MSKLLMPRRSQLPLLAAALLAGCAALPAGMPGSASQPPIVFVQGNGDTAAGNTA